MDENAKSYLSWENTINQSAAAGYITKEFKYHMPTIPLPLMKHEYFQEWAQMAPQLIFDTHGFVNIQEMDTNAINDVLTQQPTWRATWLERRLQDTIHYEIAPYKVRLNPLYCPIRQRLTWK